MATSSDELNMPEMKAVFLCTLDGWPTSLSFLTTLCVASSSRSTPVAEIRKDLRSVAWYAKKPVFGGVEGP